jgi:DNA-binding MarR family transcriptional regulator
MATKASSRAIAEAWELLGELVLGHRTRMLAIASEFELAPAQVMALKALEPGHPRPMSELAAALRCDNSNVTGIVDRLEDRGLVARRPGTTDRRVKMLEVTEAGAELRRRIAARMAEPPQALASLSDDDARALRDILARALER